MKPYLFAFLVCCLFARASAQSLTVVQKQQVMFAINTYKENLTNYCTADENTLAKIENTLSNLFASYSDLNQATDIGGLTEAGLDNLNITNYLDTLRKTYRGRASMRFLDGQLFDCISSVDGARYSIYEVNKSIFFAGRRDTAQQVIMVTLPEKQNDRSDYKIYAVFSAAFFKNESFGRNLACNNLVVVTGEDQRAFKLKELADNADKDGAYEDALKNYLYLTDRYPNDPYLTRKINTCIREINADYFNSRNDTEFARLAKNDAAFYLAASGDRAFKQKNYNDANSYYRWSLQLFPHKDSVIVAAKSSQVVKLLSDSGFRADSAEAAQAYRANDLHSAQFHLQQANIYKPGNSAVVNLLTTIKKTNGDEASAAIKAATDLLDNDDKKYAVQYFRTLQRYEPYTKLTARQYLKMLMILLADGSFNKDLRDNKWNAEVKDYASKLTQRLNKNNETDPDTRNMARILLDEVIPNKFKNN